MNETLNYQGLASYDQEELLHHLHFERERARQHSLSEVSELVLHDLTNPLSVVKFCIDQLETNPELLLQKPQYLDKLKTNLDRAFNIIDSFRAVVRPDSGATSSRIDFCHKAAIKMNLAKLRERQHVLSVNFDSSLEGIVIGIPHFEMVYFIDTIYRMMIFDNPRDVMSPISLTIKKEGIDHGLLSVRLSSNVSLLDLFGERESTDTGSFNSLNLRAIQQQLHSFGGGIELLQRSPNESTETSIRIRLPLLQIGEGKGANQ